MAGGMTCSKGRIVVILGAMEGEEEDTSREEEEVRGWTLPVKALLFPALCPEFVSCSMKWKRPGTVVTHHMTLDIKLNGRPRQVHSTASLGVIHVWRALNGTDLQVLEVQKWFSSAPSYYSHFLSGLKHTDATIPVYQYQHHTDAFGFQPKYGHLGTRLCKLSHDSEWVGECRGMGNLPTFQTLTCCHQPVSTCEYNFSAFCLLLFFALSPASVGTLGQFLFLIEYAVHLLLSEQLHSDIVCFHRNCVLRLMWCPYSFWTPVHSGLCTCSLFEAPPKGSMVKDYTMLKWNWNWLLSRITDWSYRQDSTLTALVCSVLPQSPPPTLKHCVLWAVVLCQC